MANFRSIMKIIYKNYLVAALHAYLQILKLLFLHVAKFQEFTISLDIVCAALAMKLFQIVE